MFLIDFSEFTAEKFLEGLKYDPTLSSYLSTHRYEGGYALVFNVNGKYLTNDPVTHQEILGAYIIHSTLKSFNDAFHALNTGKDAVEIHCDIGCNAIKKTNIRKKENTLFLTSLHTGHEHLDFDNDVVNEPVDFSQALGEVRKAVDYYKETIRRALRKVAPNEVDKWMQHLFSDWLPL